MLKFFHLYSGCEVQLHLGLVCYTSQLDFVPFTCCGLRWSKKNHPFRSGLTLLTHKHRVKTFPSSIGVGLRKCP